MPAPPKMELIVFVALLTVVVWAAARLMVLPERTIAPEADAKVISPASTGPLTVMVPVVRPVAPLPKLTESVVAVVTLFARTTVVPAASVLQPSVAVPVVGAAQVPEAAPNPAVPLLPSQ